MREIDEIIIHCSVSIFGDYRHIRQWHLERGWSDCGYHFIVMNGIRNYKSIYKNYLDGLIECARPIEKNGAHCLTKNATSIGVCLIGVEEKNFTTNQFDSLERLCRKLVLDYKGINKINGHYKYANKNCPNFIVENFVKERNLL